MISCYNYQPWLPDKEEEECKSVYACASMSYFHQQGVCGPAVDNAPTHFGPFSSVAVVTVDGIQTAACLHKQTFNYFRWLHLRTGDHVPCSKVELLESYIIYRGEAHSGRRRRHHLFSVKIKTQFGAMKGEASMFFSVF